MNEPVWLTKALLLAVHGSLLAEHGGATGLRDEGLLESAVAAPKNAHEYGDGDIFDVAGALANAIARNHPFMDGNKRTAFTAAGVFLELNGYRLAASEADAVGAVVALAAGEMSAEEFGKWLRISSEEMGD